MCMVDGASSEQGTNSMVATERRLYRSRRRASGHRPRRKREWVAQLFHTLDPLPFHSIRFSASSARLLSLGIGCCLATLVTIPFGL